MIGVSADRRWALNGRLSLLTMGGKSPALRPLFNGEVGRSAIDVDAFQTVQNSA